MANWKEHTNRAKSGAQRLAAGIKQKSRHVAVMNRLRTVIRCQERAAEKEYLALGRYYYNALRDNGNQVAEEHCKRLDRIQEQLDATLKSLEREASAMGFIIAGMDDPEAVHTSEEKKQKDDGTLFHFDGGPIEITVKRDMVYHPEDENSEEIDLSDVKSFDHDPMPEDAGLADKAETAAGKPEDPAGPEPVPAKPELNEAGSELSGADPELSGAELDENDSLPFEG